MHWLQSKIQRTWVGDRLEAVIMNEVQAGQEVSLLVPCSFISCTFNDIVL